MKMSGRSAAAVAALVALVLLVPTARGAQSPFADPGDRFRAGTGTWKGLWAFENVNLVTMVPGAPARLRRQTVIVRNGIIESIGRSRDTQIPARAKVIDGRRRYLAPGMIDSHVHIWMGDGRYAGFDEQDLWTLFLANGITTVMEMIGADLNNNPREFLFDWRDDVAAGRSIGPSLLVASPRFRDDQQRNIAEIDAAVKLYAELGYDFIKVHAPNSLPNYLRLFEQARIHGIQPMGHPPYRSTDVPVQTVIQNQSMVSHTQLLMYQYLRRLGGVNLTPAQMDDLAEQLRAAGTVLQPTPATTGILYWYQLDEEWNRASTAEWLRYFPQSLRVNWIERNEIRNGNGDPERSRVNWNFIVEQSRRIAAAGVPMIAGSDSGGLDLTPHGFFFHEELASLNRDVGLSPWRTLEAATRNNANYLGVGDQVGTIQVGKRADLVLFEANPLRNIANARRIGGVMVRGKWIPAQRLQQALDDLATRMNGPLARTHEIVPIERGDICHLRGDCVDSDSTR